MNFTIKNTLLINDHVFTAQKIKIIGPGKKLGIFIWQTGRVFRINYIAKKRIHF